MNYTSLESLLNLYLNKSIQNLNGEGPDFRLFYPEYMNRYDLDLTPVFEYLAESKCKDYSIIKLAKSYPPEPPAEFRSRLENINSSTLKSRNSFMFRSLKIKNLSCDVFNRTHNKYTQFIYLNTLELEIDHPFFKLNYRSIV